MAILTSQLQLYFITLTQHIKCRILYVQQSLFSRQELPLDQLIPLLVVLLLKGNLHKYHNFDTRNTRNRKLV